MRLWCVRMSLLFSCSPCHHSRWPLPFWAHVHASHPLTPAVMYQRSRQPADMFFRQQEAGDVDTPDALAERSEACAR